MTFEKVYIKVMFINGYSFCFSVHLKGTNFSDLVKKRILIQQFAVYSALKDIETAAKKKYH